MYINTTGIVLRETAYRDSSKILTVLTGGEGKLIVTARGALRRNSKLAAVTQFLAFSEMTLFLSRERWTLTEARSVEQFIGLRDDISTLALGSYFAELTEAAADEDSPNPELLPLILNALFALSEKMKAPDFIKPAFELRLMAISGFAPSVESCALCGKKEPERAYLGFVHGTICCEDCHCSLPRISDTTQYSGVPQSGSMPLGKTALAAARYIINCDPKKLLSFSLGESARNELEAAVEGYLLTQFDRRFRTLEYYKTVNALQRLPQETREL